MKRIVPVFGLAFPVVACTVSGIGDVMSFPCGAALPYGGLSVRDPVPASATRLTVNRDSGLSAKERTALGIAFGEAKAKTNADSLTAAIWQSGG